MTSRGAPLDAGLDLGGTLSKLGMRAASEAVGHASAPSSGAQV